LAPDERPAQCADAGADGGAATGITNLVPDYGADTCAEGGTSQGSGLSAV
jgi:hypothetical protein